MTMQIEIAAKYSGGFTGDSYRSKTLLSANRKLASHEDLNSNERGAVRHSLAAALVIVAVLVAGGSYLAATRSAPTLVAAGEISRH